MTTKETKKPAPRPIPALKLATILVPIDFSAASLASIAWAKFIARRTRADIHLVHVHNLGYPVSVGLTPPVIGTEAEIRDRLHRDLRAIAKAQGITHPNFHIRVGRPFEQIQALATEIQADLIASSTHGRTGWERTLLGSTAERILRHAPCPVLVARKSGRRSREINLRRIVVPVDFSDCAARGLRYAIELAQPFGAEVAVLNVVELHHDLPPSIIYSDARLSRWAREVAESHMVDLIKATDFGKVKFETAVKTGAPAQRVSRYARKVRADLIVCSTHGRTGLAHALLGSVAEQVVRYASLPVLVVPSHARRLE